MSETSKLFKPPFSLVTIKRPTPKGEFFMRIVNVDGADLKGKDLREVLCRANSQPDLLKAFVKYGNHRDYCNLSSLIPCIKKNGKEIGCTCGFEAALAKAKKVRE